MCRAEAKFEMQSVKGYNKHGKKCWKRRGVCKKERLYRSKIKGGKPERGWWSEMSMVETF